MSPFVGFSSIIVKLWDNPGYKIVGPITLISNKSLTKSAQFVQSAFILFVNKTSPIDKSIIFISKNAISDESWLSLFSQDVVTVGLNTFVILISN